MRKISVLFYLINFFPFGAGIEEHEPKHANDTSTGISDLADLMLHIQVTGPDLDFCYGHCCSRTSRCRAVQSVVVSYHPVCENRCSLYEYKPDPASYIYGNFTFEKFVDHRTNRCLTTPEQFNCKSWSKKCRYGGTSTILQGKSLFDSKWKIVERGRFDVPDWENRTLTKILPELPSLATRLYDLTKRAQLYSEKIPCTEETAASKNFDPNIEVSFKFWATKNITLTIFLYDPVKDTVIASSSVFHQKSKLYPGPFHVKFVHFSQEPFVVRFLAQGTFKAPGYLFLDDVTYAGRFCQNSTCLSTVKSV